MEEIPARSKKPPKRPIKTCRRKTKRPKQIKQYAIRNQELKMEEAKCAQRRSYNWERRRLRKVERMTEVMNVSGWLAKKFTRAPELKRKRTNRVKHTATKMRRRPIRTTYIVEEEDSWR